MPRELIVIVKPEVGLKPGDQGLVADSGADLQPLFDVLASKNASMEPVFDLSSSGGDNTQAVAPDEGDDEIDLGSVFTVNADDADLDGLADQLRQSALIQTAYVKPATEVPVMMSAAAADPAAPPAPPTALPAATPDLSSRQGYLDVAPGGVDAFYAWTQTGGDGAGVNVIDLEGGWNLTHEDLQHDKGGLLFGAQIADPGFKNHGTAVLGEIAGDPNNVGVTGVSPNASVSVVSHSPKGTAKAIQFAADRLRPGDVLLLEAHRPGPRYAYASRNDQAGYIAIEWWYDDYLAIRYAVKKGVIVVEAAGNGNENLDDPIYDGNPGFPAAWKNPFNAGNRSSGAVVVGAGAAPTGTHGRAPNPDRSRMWFSNYGSRLDVQAWGEEVTTTGYGDLQGGAGTDENRWYTDTFGGTSSASPIVTGVVASIQGVLRARGATPLAPSAMRNLLRNNDNGTPQLDAPTRPATQRIGNRPDLRKLVTSIAGISAP